MDNYDEILSFSQLDDHEEIKALAHSLPDKSLAFNQLFKLACIKENLNAAQFIYHECTDQQLELNINSGLVLSTKYGDGDLVKYFIDLKKDMTFNDNELLHKALKNKSHHIIFHLLKYCKYDKKLLNTIYDYALKNSSYDIMIEVEKQDPSIAKQLTVNKINTILEPLDEMNIQLSSDETRFVLELIERGGNVHLFDDSLVIPYMIANKEYNNIAQFLLKGLNMKKLSKGAVSFAAMDDNIPEAQLEAHFEKCQKFLDKHYTEFNLNCIPAYLRGEKI